MTAFFSGRDLSGQEVLALTPQMLAAENIPSMACESCGFTLQAVR